MFTLQYNSSSLLKHPVDQEYKHIGSSPVLLSGVLLNIVRQVGQVNWTPVVIDGLQLALIGFPKELGNQGTERPVFLGRSFEKLVLLIHEEVGEGTDSQYVLNNSLEAVPLASVYHKFDPNRLAEV